MGLYGFVTNQRTSVVYDVIFQRYCLLIIIIHNKGQSAVYSGLHDLSTCSQWKLSVCWQNPKHSSISMENIPIKMLLQQTNQSTVHLDPIVQRVDNTAHWINCSPVVENLDKTKYVICLFIKWIALFAFWTAKASHFIILTFGENATIYLGGGGGVKIPQSTGGEVVFSTVITCNLLHNL